MTGSAAGRRVVVTGLGAVTPVGNDVESTWAALTEGRSGVRANTTFDTTTFAVHIAGIVTGFDLADHVPGYTRGPLSRQAGFGLAATAQAVADAGLADGYHPPEARGIAMGSSVGRITLDELGGVLHDLHVRQPQRVPRLDADGVAERDATRVLSLLAELADCAGPSLNVSTACSGSAHAVGEAMRLIQDGAADVMVAGGFDSLTTWLDVLGFSLLNAITDAHQDEPARASRPFDAARSGFVLGEGAVVLVLEDLDSAVARGAPIHAELVGYSATMNAYRITDAPPDGGGCTTAMAEAIAESGLTGADIDYVASHGTSTPGNDLCETVAIKAVFGADAHRLAISSVKSMTGHLTAASGALNLLCAVLAIRHHVIPPTINQDTPDPKLDLDYVPNTARRTPVRAALVNAFAFGGTNASLVLRSAVTP
ncbi:beta-ketoacyl-[acyl-carrier-protein] synthase family protein [Solihabitans fulvus]|uniref:Beta-ketoacyl-[acyl-carrier-protein] synthase family protein n=1 Tax=Solihabitans fulvus TaxID=1892852 RepID=A0A5B2XHP0_9PSEU|nr:beta-ketoacyl-[acyl-carrier-protein] synthase family protein [Solihabitans fulvus]KAA2262694.1 beta-ketoacyl-[acyl-carrier-protein] synthase family protein [Solihabitans fulvus]